MQWGPLARSTSYLSEKSFFFFFFSRKITCRSSVGCILGLFGTTTPAKFILSHISDIPHSQPPLCLAYHLSLLLRWISFTTSWHTCLLVKMFALRLVLQLSLNFNEMLLDFFFLRGGGVFLVEWNVSKCVRAEKSKERGRGRGSISRL